MTRIILASTSGTRIAILRSAGVVFEARSPEVDERAVEAPLAAAGSPPVEITAALAEAKALGIPDAGNALVIGADQTLDADGERWHKPATMDEARVQLSALSGRSHRLHSAVAVARSGKVRWRDTATAFLTIRALTSAEIDAYLSRVGERALASVGAYQIEGPGIQLFERIEGDYFTILGLPLLPLLNWLREEGALGMTIREKSAQ
jgi:septum formation protein